MGRPVPLLNGGGEQCTAETVRRRHLLTPPARWRTCRARLCKGPRLLHRLSILSSLYRDPIHAKWARRNDMILHPAPRRPRHYTRQKTHGFIRVSASGSLAASTHPAGRWRQARGDPTTTRGYYDISARTLVRALEHGVFSTSWQAKKVKPVARAHSAGHAPA